MSFAVWRSEPKAENEFEPFKKGTIDLRETHATHKRLVFATAIKQAKTPRLVLSPRDVS